MEFSAYTREAGVKVHISDLSRLETKEGRFYLDGREVKRVRILGIVVSRHRVQAGRMVRATLDDGTGNFDIVDYVNTDKYIQGKMYDVIVNLSFAKGRLVGVVDTVAEVPDERQRDMKLLREKEIEIQRKALSE